MENAPLVSPHLATVLSFVALLRLHRAQWSGFSTTALLCNSLSPERATLRLASRRSRSPCVVAT
eukprot:SAG31_NODE_368_length_16798_cov_20.422780_7_plen_64_part_00